MTRGTRSSMAKTVMRVTVLATLVFALLGGFAGQARAQEAPQIIPHITCGDAHAYTDTSSGTTTTYKYYSAWLGYTSTYEEDKTLTAGTDNNYFNPGAFDRGQPSLFKPGRHDYSVFVAFDASKASKLFWIIDGRFVTIHADSGALSCKGEGPAAPAATTSPASGLGPTGATLNALVDPNGVDTTYRFEYADEAGYDANAPDPYARGGKTAEGTITGGDARTVHHELTGLLPGKTYHYRVVATNGLGATAAGTDQTFTTPHEPPPSNAAPTIQAVSPTPGSEIHHRTPTVRAKVVDSGTDLRKDNIRLWVDGERTERFSYDRARNLLSYETPKLGQGRHTVLIVARDGEGLSASRFWAFRVAKR